MLKIYNSLSQSKQVFKPIQPGKIGIYICGLTIYDYCHIGHARTYTAFDTIVRYLKFSGYQVELVRNVTDIDDKIINRANKNNETIAALTERFEKVMQEDFARLSIVTPDKEPKVTETIPEIINMIQILIEKDHAYQIPNGDVYFHVSSFSDYGKLSKQNLQDLQAGERVEVLADKKDPTDFVLWKSAKPEEPSWSSPWGEGRPGWHIECSAMAKKTLGDTFDIHAGGSDLRFPHHENEVAQSEASNGCSFANYWMHSGMVQVDQQKMSKSLDNFFTIREVLKEYRAESVRYFLISSHYRSQINYSQDNLESADASLQRLYSSLLDLDLNLLPEFAEAIQSENSRYLTDFKKAMDDDFNTPEAMVVLFELAKEINRLKSDNPESALSLARILITLGELLGLLQDIPESFLKSITSNDGLENDDIEFMIAERLQARADKNWQKADEIRDKLLSMGIQLEDKEGKTRWRKA